MLPPAHILDSALRCDLAAISALLGDHLHSLRERGRSPIGESVGGMVVEEGEAERLVVELQGSLAENSGAKTLSPRSPVLQRMLSLYALDVLDVNILLLAAAAEIDSRFGRLFAFLNDHAGRTRPTVGLATALFTGTNDPSAVLRRLVGNAPLLRYQLVALAGEEGHANQSLYVEPTVWQRMLGLGESSFAVECAEVHPNLETLQLSAEIRNQATKFGHWLLHASAEGRTVVVFGEQGSGRDALAKAIALQGRPSIVVVDSEALTSPADWQRLEREAFEYGAAFVRHRGDADLAVPRSFSAPLVLSSDSPSFSTLATSRSVAVLKTQSFTSQRRLVLWQSLLNREECDDTVDLEAIASRFRFGPELVYSAVRAARSDRSATGQGLINHERLQEICRRLPVADLRSLADHLECPYESQDLILRPDTRRELDLARTWATYGARLFSDQGPGARLCLGPGLACLFTGPPGTGKTMAARIVGKELGLDVYRVDLSRVVSKYIGETEKKLSRLFDAAAAANAILFFDEADALFGRRTEVKDAHDRYANVETGFLLQRMEEHPGISILATNLRKNIDDAFLRRIHIVAEFPRPGLAEREAIWHRLLPVEAHGRLDIHRLSEIFEIAGGDIRNAVMAAMLLATQGQEPLEMKHVVIGLYRELRKAGRMVEPGDFGQWRQLIVDWSRTGK